MTGDDIGRFPITRFLSFSYSKACDRFAYERGPGLVAIEQLESSYDNHHPCLRKFDFNCITWWLSIATPHDIQEEIERGFLSSDKNVHLVFGRSRRSIWLWAERERRKWLDSDGSKALMGKLYTTSVPRECPIKEVVADCQIAKRA